jgi:hypothetical protein
MAESATHPEVDDIYHASRIYADESTILILASTSATTDIVPTTTQPMQPWLSRTWNHLSWKWIYLHRNHGRFAVESTMVNTVCDPLNSMKGSNFDFAAVIGQRISYIIALLWDRHLAYIVLAWFRQPRLRRNFFRLGNWGVVYRRPCYCLGEAIRGLWLHSWSNSLTQRWKARNWRIPRPKRYPCYLLCILKCGNVQDCDDVGICYHWWSLETFATARQAYIPRDTMKYTEPIAQISNDMPQQMTGPQSGSEYHRLDNRSDDLKTVSITKWYGSR